MRWRIGSWTDLLPLLVVIVLVIVPGYYELRRRERRREEQEEAFQEALALGERESQAAMKLATVEHEILLTKRRGEYDTEEAIRLYEGLLRELEQMLGSKHFLVADCLHNLGDLQAEKGDYQEAGALYSRCLSIYADSGVRVHAKEERSVREKLSNLPRRDAQ